MNRFIKAALLTLTMAVLSTSGTSAADGPHEERVDFVHWEKQATLSISRLDFDNPTHMRRFVEAQAKGSEVERRHVSGVDREYEAYARRNDLGQIFMVLGFHNDEGRLMQTITFVVQKGMSVTLARAELEPGQDKFVIEPTWLRDLAIEAAKTGLDVDPGVGWEMVFDSRKKL